jgi:hypothetical protein
MNYKNLHTHTLEQLFGPISIHIKKQNKTIRIVELKDDDNFCRTLAIVRFVDVHGQALKKAYETILSGELLGKTLHDSKIDFDKKYKGSLQVKLPDWLKNDFKTEHDLGIAFLSHIWVMDGALEEQEFIFAEIIEIIPQELKLDFKYKINPLQTIDSKISDLFKEANIDLKYV